MTMSEEQMDEMLRGVRDRYHVPSETPRDEMWSVISSRLGTPASDVVDISIARRSRIVPSSRSMRWAVAASAVLALGVGIGRMTVPGGTEEARVVTMQVTPTAMALAAREHMNRTESLLTMVRADVRSGRIDAMTAQWARGLLSQTRLLIDVQAGGDRQVDDLLLDLELVLAQIVGVAQTGSMDEARARTELELAWSSVEDGEVLSRIRAAFPVGMAGT